MKRRGVVPVALVCTLVCVLRHPVAAQGIGGAPGQFAAPNRVWTEIATRSDSGRVFCAIYDSSHASAYPTHRDQALLRIWADISGRRAICNFDVPPGSYAIAVYHDENGNGRLDTGIFGIPTEGTGASNNARASFGPPSFDAARFVYRGGGIGTVRIRVNY